MDGVVQDVRYGLRMVWSSKGFSAVVVLTLGLAIGANSTLFTFVSHTILRSVPFRDTEALAFVSFRNEALSRVRAPVSFPDFADLRHELTSFEALVAMAPEERTLTGLDEPARVGAYRVSAGFFDTMGVELLAGRSFLPEEDRPSGPHVAVLSHGAWQRRFGGDRVTLGSEVELDGERYDVVGILPPSMEIGPFEDVEVWTPLALAAGSESRDDRSLFVGGRLRPGVDVAQANLEVEAATSRLAEEHPGTNRGWTGYALSFRQTFLGANVATVFTLFLTVVVFVLLIACANVANMMLARGAVRAKEVAVRSALGAGRVRLVRQLLTESVVLASLAAVTGLILTLGTFRVLSVVASGLPLPGQVVLDPAVLAFTFALGLLTPVVFGLVPALSTTRSSVATVLRGEGRGSRSRIRGRGLLVAGQVALAIVLLVVAGLLVRSIQALSRIELGFDPSDVLTMTVELPEWRYDEPAKIAAFFHEAKDAVAREPGIADVGLVSHRPIVGGEPNRALQIEGRDVASAGDGLSAATIVASPEFFSVLRVPLLRGRLPSSEDTASRPRVAVISQAAAERYWPDESPLGQRIRLGGEGEASAASVEIVGVVGDLRNPDADQPPEPHLYLPFAQHPAASMAFVARVSASGEREAARVSASVRDRIHAIDPAQPVEDVRTMAQIVYDDLSGSFAFIGLVGYFALLALVLAAAGIYGVLSYTVHQRSHEFGIRMALGARAVNVWALVLRQGLIPVLGGALAGLVGALGLSRAIASLLYGVTATDPVTYFGVASALAGVALVATLVPAVRATSGDPLTSLRHG